MKRDYHFFLIQLSLLALTIAACNINNKPNEDNMSQEQKHEYTNELIHESSPYLLQHAHNPVNWHPWNETTLNKARNEDKMILVSIGYAACHWCHVMEKESFEDTVVAKVMNENFICIKVDREERPDIDQVYMNAVQLMTGRGGWPLNCFALPDGRPVYGGTYYPKKQWLKLMKSLIDLQKNEPGKLYEYAEKLTAAVQQSDLIEMNEDEGVLDKELITIAVEKWKNNWDKKEGGPNRAPKFPIPNNFSFLLRYGYMLKDRETIDYVELTLKKMAYGGIYDQIGGGFARYSTDEIWKVPHFEKMLYDNAQLISLYSEAYNYNQKPLYKSVVKQSIEFVEREMTSEEGAFYSSLDADSEGEEGKYYVWKKEELEGILGDDYELFTTYYHIDSKGHWENGNYVLMRTDLSSSEKKEIGLSESELSNKIKELNHKLLVEREKRIKPGLDDKTLTSWNVLMSKAYLDAYAVFKNEEYLNKGETSLNFILKNLVNSDGGLYHNYKNGKATLNGYLEDYCFTIEALIKMYQVTFDLHWLEKANDLMKYCILNFYDESSGMFYFTSEKDVALIARKMEINDNVIPASNSSIALSLFHLGNYYYNEDYLNKSKVMLRNVYSSIPDYPSGYSNWCILAMEQLYPFYEIAISGKNAVALASDFSKNYVPNKLLMGSTDESELPLLENKFQKGETFIYVCVNKSCQLPVQSVEEAMSQIRASKN